MDLETFFFVIMVRPQLLPGEWVMINLDDCPFACERTRSTAMFELIGKAWRAHGSQSAPKKFEVLKCLDNAEMPAEWDERWQIRAADECIPILGQPVGSDQACAHWWRSKIQAAEESFSILGKMPRQHVAHLLATYCVPAKDTHLALSRPPSGAWEGAARDAQDSILIDLESSDSFHTTEYLH